VMRAQVKGVTKPVRLHAKILKKIGKGVARHMAKPFQKKNYSASGMKKVGRTAYKGAKLAAKAVAVKKLASALK